MKISPECPARKPKNTIKTNYDRRVSNSNPGNEMTEKITIPVNAKQKISRQPGKPKYEIIADTTKVNNQQYSLHTHHFCAHFRSLGLVGQVC